MSWRHYRQYEHFKRSTPRETKGGIKAHSKRGSFGESWWAKRWIEVLESFQIGARLGRGRSYARKGQVLSIDIEKGSVAAKVQGSRSAPYRVAIKVKPLSESQWTKLTESLAGQAIFAAKLLAGEMPADVEKAFAELGLSLFPEKLKDLGTDCSCPDWSNPCKHVAAVYYLLGEEFDRDPFLIFKMRGMGREDLLGRMGSRGAADSALPEPAVQAPPEPLPADPDGFWRGAELPNDVFGEVNTPSAPAALPRRLGGFPFWRGREPLVDALDPIYDRASRVSMDIFLGQYAK